LRTAVEKLDGREFKGARVTCVADVRMKSLSHLNRLTACRPSLMYPVIGIAPDLPVVVHTQMTMIDVDPHVATVHAVTDIVIEALPDEAITMTEADMIALLLGFEDPSMITHHQLVLVATMMHTAGIILHHLTHI
jgi:hypothetical protein